MLGFPGSSAGKEAACNAGDLGLIWAGKIPRRRERLPTPVFWPGESHGMGSQSQTRLSNLHFLPVCVADITHWDKPSLLLRVYRIYKSVCMWRLGMLALVNWCCHQWKKNYPHPPKKLTLFTGLEELKSSTTVVYVVDTRDRTTRNLIGWTKPWMRDLSSKPLLSILHKEGATNPSAIKVTIKNYYHVLNLQIHWTVPYQHKYWCCH